MSFAKIPLIVVLMSSALAGCVHAPPTLYQWGGYEDRVYEMYADPGKTPIENQLQSLESDYQQISASGGVVPPGFHAHLGYLYFQAGKLDLALKSFETEKSLFPESTVFMDRLMARIKQ